MMPHHLHLPPSLARKLCDVYEKEQESLWEMPPSVLNNDLLLKRGNHDITQQLNDRGFIFACSEQPLAEQFLNIPRSAPFLFYSFYGLTQMSRAHSIACKSFAVACEMCELEHERRIMLSLLSLISCSEEFFPHTWVIKGGDSCAWKASNSPLFGEVTVVNLGDHHLVVEYLTGLSVAEECALVVNEVENSIPVSIRTGRSVAREQLSPFEHFAIDSSATYRLHAPAGDTIAVTYETLRAIS